MLLLPADKFLCWDSMDNLQENMDSSFKVEFE
jgi:hypothetical protein